MIASWTKPLAGPENTAARPSASETRQAAPPVANTAPETLAPSAPAISSFDPEQAKQMAQSLDALLQAVERLAATQDQMKREMTRLQAADLEILAKIPAPPPQSPATPKRKPPAVPPQREKASCFRKILATIDATEHFNRGRWLDTDHGLRRTGNLIFLSYMSAG